MRLLNWNVLIVTAIALSASTCAEQAKKPGAATQPATAAATQATMPAATQLATLDVETQAYELRVLVASLSAVDPQARADAKRQLIKTGKPAIKPLEELIKTTPDPVARQLAREILDDVNGAAPPAPAPAAQVGVWEATPVSLHFDKAPAREVYESLYQQAGMDRFPLRPRWGPVDRHPWHRADNTPVTIHLDRVSFWDAIVELEKQTGLTVTEGMRGDSAVLDRSRDPHDRPPMRVHGPFLLVADGRESSGHFRTLTVYTEPKLRVAPASIDVRVDAALDRAGRSVEPMPTGRPSPPRGFEVERPPHRGPYDLTNVLLAHVPPRAPLAYFKGVIHAKLVYPEDTKEVVVDQLNDGKAHLEEAGGLALDVTKVGGGKFAVTIRLRDEFGERARYARLSLEDAKGNPLQPDGYTSYQRLAGEFSATWTFNALAAVGPPTKLSVQIPLKPRLAEIPFEFGKRPTPPK